MQNNLERVYTNLQNKKKEIHKRNTKYILIVNTSNAISGLIKK